MPKTPLPGVQGPLRCLVPSLVGLQTVTGQETREDAPPGEEQRDRGRWLLCTFPEPNSEHLPGRALGREDEVGPWLGVSGSCRWPRRRSPVLAVSPFAEGHGGLSLPAPWGMSLPVPSCSMGHGLSGGMASSHVQARELTVLLG